MNLRQKAKHFKKLYEQSLPQKPYPVVYKTVLPKHYKVETYMNFCEAFELENKLPQVYKAHIVNRIIQEIEPMIWDNLKSERDLYSDRRRYWIDIWLESGESEADNDH